VEGLSLLGRFAEPEGKGVLLVVGSTSLRAFGIAESVCVSVVGGMADRRVRKSIGAGNRRGGGRRLGDVPNHHVTCIQ